MLTNVTDLVELGGHQLSPCGVHPLHHHHLTNSERINYFLPCCFTQTWWNFRGIAEADVRVLGRMLSEPAAQLLGTLCCSWWLCSLMHTA